MQIALLSAAVLLLVVGCCFVNHRVNLRRLRAQAQPAAPGFRQPTRPHITGAWLAYGLGFILVVVVLQNVLLWASVTLTCCLPIPKDEADFERRKKRAQARMFWVLAAGALLGFLTVAGVIPSEFWSSRPSPLVNVILAIPAALVLLRTFILDWRLYRSLPPGYSASLT